MAGGFHRPRNSIQPCALPAIHRRGANKQLNTSPRAWLASWGLLAAPPLRQPGIQAPPAVWRAHGIRRSQMRRRYEGAHRPVQRPPWVIRRASCGVAVRPRCDAGPDRNRAPGPGRARAAPCGPRPLTGLGKGLRSTARAPSGKPWPEGARGCTCHGGGAPGFARAQPGGEHTRGWPRWSTS
jgi:hypothetical protein